MESILEAIYYGNLRLSEKPPTPGSSAEKDQAAYYHYALKLEKTLSGKEKELFEAFAEANQELCEHSCCEYLCDGFRIGARMILEIFQSNRIPHRSPEADHPESNC